MLYIYDDNKLHEQNISATAFFCCFRHIITNVHDFTVLQVYSYLPSVLIHALPFINHLKITLKVLDKKKSNYFIVQSLSKLAPVKSFCLVREIPERAIEFLKRMFPETFLLVLYTFHIKFYFLGKRQRKSTKNLSKTCH